jgi:signal transduction histidine kinase
VEAGQVGAMERLVLAADADRRKFERELHEGVQQHLVALAVNLQLAAALIATDVEAAKKVVEEMQHDVQQALDDTARLAQAIYPPLLDADGLAAAMRAAAVSAGVPASVDVAVLSSYPPELARTLYFCWVDVLEHAGGETRPAISVREEGGALTFEFRGSETRLDSMRDRVEALGGRLSVDADSRVYGSLPLSAR